MHTDRVFIPNTFLGMSSTGRDMILILPVGGSGGQNSRLKPHAGRPTGALVVPPGQMTVVLNMSRLFMLILSTKKLAMRLYDPPCTFLTTSAEVRSPTWSIETFPEAPENKLSKIEISNNY